MFDDVFNLLWDDKNKYKLYDKKERTRDIVLYMLSRTQEIFIWEGLPDTIPQHNLEMLLQLHGNACLTEVTNIPEGHGEDGLYLMFGGLGGMLNAYYEPTLYTVANPYLNFSKNLEIGKDCVRARNDAYGIGLLPMFAKYGAMMNENEISMNMVSICYRIDNLISADDDRTYESAKQFLNDIVEGQFGAISSSEFFDGIRNDKTSSSSRTIKDLIEYEQYIKASWYNEIGLNSNYNMKRERMVASESEMMDDALIPYVNNMLNWRLKFCDDARELYGDKYDLSKLNVKLNSVWDLDKSFVGILPEGGLDENGEPEDVDPDIKTDETDPEDVDNNGDVSEDGETIEDETTPEDVDPDSDPNETDPEDVDDNGDVSERSEDEKVINIDINISTTDETTEDEEKEGEEDEDKTLN